MQGPSELDMRKDAKLVTWDRIADLENIMVPTFTIVAH